MESPIKCAHCGQIRNVKSHRDSRETPTLNAPAYGTFLADEFLTLLGPVPPGKRVMPLTVMTIDDLENLESSIDEFGLRQLLADYAAACPDGLRSLHNFMATAPAYADKLKPGAQLMENSERLLRHAHRELFPDSPELDPGDERVRQETTDRALGDRT